MLSKFNNKKHRRLTALLLCVALMLGSVTSVSADISAADSETEVQNYSEEPTTEAVSYEAPETQAEVQEETSVAEETEAPAADTQQTEAHTEVQRKHIQRRQLRHRRLRQQLSSRFRKKLQKRQRYLKKFS